MIGIALVGAGRIGSLHAANVSLHPRLRLVAVYDFDPAAARRVAQATGAEQARFEEILSDSTIEGVVIASPTTEHLSQARACAAAAKAILLEKPVDLDPEKAREAARDLCKARLLVGFNRRFDQHFLDLKAQIDRGAIGALESLSIISGDPAPPPATYLEKSGGIFKDMAIHDFDIARFFLSEEPTTIFAMGSALFDPAASEAGDFDTARTLLSTASGKLAAVANTRRSGVGYDQRIEAFGSKGVARAGNPRRSTVAVSSETGTRSAPLLDFFLDRYAEAYRAEMDHFADVIAGAKPRASFADGLAALEIAQAAGLSAKSGEAVRLG
ncbi:MAG: inositol 2-dehydrogenase [Caulobacteraceae bacterium]